MEHRTALTVALACGGLAIALVAVDLAFNLTASVQADEDGEWVTITSTKQDQLERFPGEDGCVEDRFRVVVDNNRPVGATVDVLVEQTGNQTTVLYQETWELGAFSSQQEVLELEPGDDRHGLSVRVDDMFLHSCIGSGGLGVPG